MRFEAGRPVSDQALGALWALHSLVGNKVLPVRPF